MVSTGTLIAFGDIITWVSWYKKGTASFSFHTLLCKSILKIKKGKKSMKPRGGGSKPFIDLFLHNFSLSRQIRLIASINKIKKIIPSHNHSLELGFSMLYYYSHILSCSTSSSNQPPTLFYLSKKVKNFTRADNCLYLYYNSMAL